MTNATITRTSTPARTIRPAPMRAQPPADDVAAMAQALARARGEPRGAAGQLARQNASLARTPGFLQPAATDPGAELARTAGWRAADERGGLDRRDAERGGEQALGLVSPAHAPPAGAAMLPAPPPHVDPSGFAQMLADLWTRENGRGDRHVRVRFGADAWPATGALLVQSPDGVLDVTVDIAAGGTAPSSVDLIDAFETAGLSVGRVTTQEGAEA